jgi:hypothetical protein
MQRGASNSEFGRTCILINRQKRLEQYETSRPLSLLALAAFAFVSGMVLEEVHIR